MGLSSQLVTPVIEISPTGGSDFATPSPGYNALFERQSMPRFSLAPIEASIAIVRKSPRCFT
ncbi:MAG: hypothetical protein BHV89_13830 [Clostridiales bacterium 41_21_two_genomes]|jgi:hypothetical protein|nr:MAG: hypothetical protein BHV89_13830 [Clostridiales bacterium 41_21_two_genomes]